ncbi:metallophosphoesterase family protein [Primorskyibacter sedentarius]|uniref:Serine/threonine protein phosphatase 1 n=1 Tax=Primorskyibacter sedentarius TaxID=745311 RepID=A0A4V2UPN6_9RHOB|nr:metallophosphoesterase family protein [Primorskyibacter sedentarius]TCS66236.1 serine/threonine protein phosphatase 1 [Primorskyibacter sedentarius]
MTQPLFAIGDIHGQFDAMQGALSKIEADPDFPARVVFLGDYLDRGPQAKDVIQCLIDGIAAGRDWVALMGNHDRYMLKFLETPRFRDPNTRDHLEWLDSRIGGRETLASYGVDAHSRRSPEDIHADAVEAIPQAHIDFIRNLPLMHVTDEHIFVHAGIRPGVPLDEQVEEDLIWIRKGFLEDTRDHGRLVVHGHTALHVPQRYENRVNLDGGAGYGRPLYPAIIEGRAVSLLAGGHRVPL